MKIQEIINKIIELETIEDIPASKTIIHKDKQIGYSRENHLKFLEFIAQAYNYDQEIKKTFTLKKFQKLFIDKFFDNLYSSTKIKICDATSFVGELKSEKNQKYYVFRNIFGINLDDTSKIHHLGDYKIYHFDTHKKIIESKTTVNPNLIWMAGKPNYLIEWEVKARHAEKALEIADQYFRRFELIFRFIMSSAEREYEVGILNYKGRFRIIAYCFSEDGGWTTQADSSGSIFNTDLDNPIYINKDIGHDYIWKLTNKNLNKFQKRLLLAIEWIGQSMIEQSIQNAFLKCAIALEIIFTFSEKTIVTPSILNQISVSIAILIGTSVDDRVEMESKVKKLYSLRSAIVHSGNKDINESDYYSILNIARSVIYKLITDNKLKRVNSVEDFFDLIRRKKYSCELF